MNRDKAVEVLSRRKVVAEQAKRLFRQTERTQEWAESNYYRLLIAQQTAALVPVNRFWADYAAWDGTQPFVSAHLADAAGSFTEMVLALAATALVAWRLVRPPGPAEFLARDVGLFIAQAAAIVALVASIGAVRPRTQ